MQIREQGKQVQLIRSPYDPEKKRCVQKVIGHFPRYSDEKPSADLLNILTDDERKQLDAWFAARSDKQAAGRRQSAVILASMHLEGIAAAVDLMTPEQAAATWSAIGRLQVALKKAGHKRPKVAGQPASDVGSRQQSLV